MTRKKLTRQQKPTEAAIGRRFEALLERVPPRYARALTSMVKKVEQDLANPHRAISHNDKLALINLQCFNHILPKIPKYIRLL